MINSIHFNALFVQPPQGHEDFPLSLSAGLHLLHQGDLFLMQYLNQITLSLTVNFPCPGLPALVRSWCLVALTPTSTWQSSRPPSLPTHTAHCPTHPTRQHVRPPRSPLRSQLYVMRDPPASSPPPSPPSPTPSPPPPARQTPPASR